MSRVVGRPPWFRVPSARSSDPRPQDDVPVPPGPPPSLPNRTRTPRVRGSKGAGNSPRSRWRGTERRRGFIGVASKGVRPGVLPGSRYRSARGTGCQDTPARVRTGTHTHSSGSGSLTSLDDSGGSILVHPRSGLQACGNRFGAVEGQFSSGRADKDFGPKETVSFPYHERDRSRRKHSYRPLGPL